jgi:CBS domain-containing protein
VAEGLDPQTTSVEKIMSRDLTTCLDDQALPDAAKLMETTRVRRLPVLNHKDQLVGIMTVGDLSHHASRALVGEIEDRITRH